MKNTRPPVDATPPPAAGADHEDTPAALAAGTSVLIGRYSADLSTGQWWWSDEIYRMHGYDPGQVEPDSSTLRRHHHGDERDTTAADAVTALSAGRAFASHRRVVDARGRSKHLLVTGQPRRSHETGDGQIAGYMVDVSAIVADGVQQKVRRAIDAAFVTAAAIERAQGILMAVHGIDEGRAEAMLVRESGRTGAGLQQTAAQVVDALAAGEGFGDDAAQRVREAFDGVKPVARPHLKEAQLSRRRKGSA